MNIAWTVILVVICCVSCFYSSAETRQKRIIYGAPIRNAETGYEAVKWFAWIGKGRLWSYAAPQDWQTQNEKCGGVLLTPNTVQTACSCMTNGWMGRKEGDWNYPQWDGERVDIVLGHAVWDGKVQTIPMEKWAFHPLCRKVTGKNFDWVSHDYMLIGRPTAFVSPSDRTANVAPVYKLHTMTKAWNRIHSKNMICLLIGMGQYAEGSTESAYKIFHGWRRVMNYRQCVDEYRKDVGTNTTKFGNVTNYQTFSTWTCLQILRYKRPTDFFSGIAYPGVGDLGSPVSCDNTYFGILNKNLFVTAIVFNAYHNAFEYRADMQREFDLFYIENRPDSVSVWSRYDKFKIPTMKHDPFEIKPDDLTPLLSPPKSYFRNLLLAETDETEAEIDLKKVQASNTADVRPFFFQLIILLAIL